ncbi:MAG: DUF192 domain-containing protein [Deltaproteobacteria bacterium]|nr:DUF192 domain-containing protein [Deltaproteobacteria bacterium]
MLTHSHTKHTTVLTALLTQVGRLIAWRACFVALMVPGCGGAVGGVAFETRPLLIQTVQKTITLQVEIADTDEKRTRGLMERSSLKDDGGMLFVFDSEGALSFWMKDTSISLDILFINAQKEIVYIEQHTTPFSLNSIAPNVSAQYALEVNAGFALEQGVAVGDRVSF